MYAALQCKQWEQTILQVPQARWSFTALEALHKVDRIWYHCSDPADLSASPVRAFPALCMLTVKVRPDTYTWSVGILHGLYVA
jgi:hypothetical protein